MRPRDGTNAGPLVLSRPPFQGYAKAPMRAAREPAPKHLLALGVGLALLLVYALPVFVPPPGTWSVPAVPGTPVLERLFPHVPGWWIAVRLLALATGAALLAVTAGMPHRVPDRTTAADSGIPAWALRAALAAAIVHIACLPVLRQLPSFLESAYLLWVFVPPGILLLGRALHRRQARGAGRRRGVAWWWWGTLAVVGAWVPIRLAASWHAPLAADCVDMFRTFGGLVRLATTDTPLLGGSMGASGGAGDVELGVVNAVQLFFEGLPLLRLFSLSPCLWWTQVVNAVWLGVAGVAVGVLAQRLVGGFAAPVATAAYLFSPYVLMAQMTPIPDVCFPLAVLLVLLPVLVRRSGSPIALVAFGGVAGLSALLPSLTLMTGFAMAVVAWRWWTGPLLSRPALLTAVLSFVALSTPSLPAPAAVTAAVDWYVLKQWPMSVGEKALQGQLSPTEAIWTNVDPPGTLLLITGTLLSPFATPRNSLRMLGDVLYEPFSTALGAVGMLICLRGLRRDWTSRYLFACLLMALVPGFVSSYDRPSLLRVYGATVPLAVFAAIGLRGMLAAARSSAARRRGVVAATLLIAASGLVVFDVVNPRILSASTFGLLMRAVDVGGIDRVAMLTSNEPALNPPDVAERDKLWHADWLRRYHPYVDDLARCAPRRPVPIIPIEQAPRLDPYDVVFWHPALDQTIRITEREVCRRWPEATLFTIWDRAHLSRVQAAQIRGEGWQPTLPAEQWETSRCAPPR